MQKIKNQIILTEMKQLLITIIGSILAWMMTYSHLQARQSAQGLEPYLSGAKLLGQGRMTYWGFDLYDAKLFVTDNKSQSGFALKIDYLKSFKGDALRDQTVKEMIQLGVPEARRRQWADALKEIFPNISSGHSLTAIYRPNLGTLFLHNGQYIGEVSGEEFSQAFFGIWLDPRTTAPHLRRQLLSDQCTPLFVSQQC